MNSTRRLRWWSLDKGEAPDPRFTLANERTFLAWIRTALALLAGGIAMEAFANTLFSPAVRLGLAVALIVLAMGVSAGACLRWLRIEQAMREDRPIPPPFQIPVLSLMVAMVTLLLAVLLLSS
ncbi:YidH family protein [Alloalcanivorax balearicus]|uniref:YidH family protein n=1 Tax=Alloalcanivorax balearicus TaxID=413232 RepID=UPI0021CDB265|nr:DUF202 domain-containing protein [Alloalcanivorax balearicus]